MEQMDVEEELFNINMFSNEILAKIFKYSSESRRKSIILVCKRWRDICAVQNLAMDQIFVVEKFVETWDPCVMAGTLTPRTFPHVKCCNAYYTFDRRKQKVFLNFFREFGRHIKYLEVWGKPIDWPCTQTILDFCTGCQVLKLPKCEHCFNLKLQPTVQTLVIERSFGEIVHTKPTPHLKTVIIEKLKIINLFVQYMAGLQLKGIVRVSADVVNFFQLPNFNITCSVKNFPTHKTLEFTDIYALTCCPKLTDAIQENFVKFSNLQKLHLSIFDDSCFGLHSNGLHSLKTLQLEMTAPKDLCRECLENQLKCSANLTTMLLNLQKLHITDIQQIAKSGKAVKLLQLKFVTLSQCTLTKISSVLNAFKNIQYLELTHKRVLDPKQDEIDPLELILICLMHPQSLQVLKGTGLKNSDFNKTSWKKINYGQRHQDMTYRLYSTSFIHTFSIEIDRLTENDFELLCKLLNNLKLLQLTITQVCKPNEPDGIFTAEFIEVLKENCQKLHRFEYTFSIEVVDGAAQNPYKIPTWIKNLFPKHQTGTYIMGTRKCCGQLSSEKLVR